MEYQFPAIIQHCQVFTGRGQDCQKLVKKRREQKNANMRKNDQLQEDDTISSLKLKGIN